MPSTKDFEKKQNHKKTHPHHHAEPEAHQDKQAHNGKAKRRPGRDHDEEVSEEMQATQRPVVTPPDVAIVDVNKEAGTDEATASVEGKHSGEPEYASADVAHETQHPDEKVELHFYGSEILRAKFPKAFEVAESVATDWIHDGSFEGLPLGHPLAQYFAAKGLKKAKEVEKKVMESPITEKVAMQALQAGMKAQEVISQIREKVQKK